MPIQQYDIFGDIHGHANKLEEMLGLLGYEFKNGHYSHPAPSRQAIFVGDFIDRGPSILRTLEVIKGMVDAGTALAVMGNHEFNAIAYHTPTPSGDGWLRSHNFSHWNQHKETLQELGEGPAIKPWIDWFRTLPFFLDLDDLRIVHACWDDWAINYMTLSRERHGGVTTDFMLEAVYEKDTKLYIAHEWVLKGKELSLPKGMEFKDKSSMPRHAVRTCWFKNPEGRTYRDYIFPSPHNMENLDKVVPDEMLDAVFMNRDTGTFYSPHAVPVFFGHYWLTLQETPEFQTPNVVCLDYSVAKEGHLCVYRWKKGEPLSLDNFILVDAKIPWPK